MTPIFRNILCLAAAGLLIACEGESARQIIGLDRTSPDEFRVVTRPPLSVPPEFSLRPPGDTQGAAASAIPMHEQAQHLVRSGGETNIYALPRTESDGIARTVAPEKAASSDMQFLKNAGAEQADPNVRTLLQEEKITRQIEKEESGWWDSITSWDKKEPVVDARKEAQRIEKNQEEGKPVNEGEVAETTDKDRGVFGRIFGDW